MYHTVLYRSSQAAGAQNSSLTIVTGANDTVQSNKYNPVQQMDLLGVMALGPSMTNARVVTPRINTITPQNISPIEVGSAWPTDAAVSDMFDYPIRLAESEQIDCQTSNDAGAPVTHSMLLFLGAGNYIHTRGPKFRMRGVGSTTLTAGAWTLVNVTWDVALPTGTYEINGMTVVSATGIVARLSVPNEYYQGGVPVCPTGAIRKPWPFLYNRFGPMGRFTTTGYPNVLIFATAADASQTVFLEVTKVA
jgi:hypothetical protein